MILLAIDCSSKTASAAVVDTSADDSSVAVLGETFLNAGLTHSETLMPMITQLLEQTRVSVEQLDAIAVTRGPGSFTGLRIGVSTVVGLAWAKSLPCLGVSSLEAAAWNTAHMGGTVCAVMDARRERVYRALFTASPVGLTRLTEDEAVPLETLRGELKNELDGGVIFVGDGAELCRDAFSDERFTLAPAHLRYPTGRGVALAAMAAGRGAFHSAELLRPEYCSGAEKYKQYEKGRA